MKKSKIIKKLIVMGLLVGTIASIGCGNVTTKTEENNGNDEIVINHELGTTILEETPENIAVLELSFLDSLYNLDIDPIAIADDNDPKKVSDVTEGELVDYTSVGKRMEPSLEELSMMDLDLIIADVSRHSEIYEDLNKIAPTIVLKSIDSSYEEYKENFKTIAKAVGKENEATEKVEEIKEFLSEVSKLSQEVVEGKTVLTVSPKNDAYTAHTSSSFVGQVLEKAGFTNVKTYGDFTFEDPKEDSERIFFVCKK